MPLAASAVLSALFICIWKEGRIADFRCDRKMAQWRGLQPPIKPQLFQVFAASVFQSIRGLKDGNN
jgi:hypothetical protein